MQTSNVSLKVVPFAIQPEAQHHFFELLNLVGCSRVITTVRRAGLGFFVFDVLGANRGTNKNVVVGKVIAVEDFGADRVEKRFGQFRLAVIDQQTNVVQLGLLPHARGLLPSLELTL